MHQQQVREIELSMEQAQEMVDLGKALNRLYDNPDFAKVIGDGYFQDEAIRLVHLKGDPSMQTQEQQIDLVKQMDAISGLRNYFRTLEHMAMQANKSIMDSEEMLQELHEEGVA